MTTLDLKQTLRSLYAPSAKAVSVVAVPPLRCLMIDGSGDPNTAPRYREAVGALYGLAYAVRALAKEAGEVFTVMPLEGLWTFDGAPVEDFHLTSADKDRFIWTLMILQPEMVDAALVERARRRAAKGKPAPALLGDVRFALYDEGEAVQIMHIGPYAAEGPTIARLHEHIARNGWALSGRHHEIYLSNPRRTPPEKMKTVLRQPFARL
ncbi:MAG: GyrI-like domain-containing protein [Anaerolineae bacterium]|nr:GyrI-like domain-containing protein [Anaerolineae bacterium]NUQ05904.1 GyrI-like domain-containing protein [Anaerolineae bacterium]